MVWNILSLSCLSKRPSVMANWCKCQENMQAFFQALERTERADGFFNRQFTFCVFEGLCPCISVSSSDPFSHSDSFRSDQPLEASPPRTDPAISLFSSQECSYQIKDTSLNFDMFPGSAKVCSGTFSCLFHMCVTWCVRVCFIEHMWVWEIRDTFPHCVFMNKLLQQKLQAGRDEGEGRRNRSAAGVTLVACTVWGLGVCVAAQIYLYHLWVSGWTISFSGNCTCTRIQVSDQFCRSMYCLFKEIRAFWHKM